MIDFHTHILPAIDDGSVDMQMTEQMLVREADMGVTTVCATPHFYAHRISVQHFLERRGRRLEKLKGLLEARPDLPMVITGAEVAYFSGMGRAERLPDLCLEGTGTILVEMPFEQWTDSVLQDIEDILYRQKLNVVLAHVERYVSMQKHKSFWEKILSMPLTLQVNCGSILAGGRRRRFCLKLMQERPRVILGSDCHNLTDRAPNMAEARKILEKKLGTDVTRRADDIALELLS